MRSVFLHLCLNIVLTTKKCLDDNVVDARPEKVHIDAYLLQVLAEGTQTPLVTKVILFCVLILNKTFVLLVDRVVRQMHELVILVNLLGVSFWSETSETLLKDVYPKWFIPGDNDIDSQVKFVAINKQWVRDILRNNAGLIHIHIVDIIHDVNTTALAGIGWLDNPYILLALVLLQLLIVVIEITEFIWQDVGIWTKVKRILAESFLKAYNIEAQTILPGNLVALRKVIDLLILVESLILVTLARTWAPEKVPLMGIRWTEAMLLKHWPAKLIIESDHLVKQLWVFNVVALLVAVVREWARNHLLVRNVLEVQELTLVLILLVVEALPRVTCLREEASLTRDRRAVSRASCRRGSVGRNAVALVFKLLQFGEKLV